MIKQHINTAVTKSKSMLKKKKPTGICQGCNHFSNSGGGEGVCYINNVIYNETNTCEHWNNVKH